MLKNDVHVQERSLTEDVPAEEIEEHKQEQEASQGLLLQAERAVSSSRDLADAAQKAQQSAEHDAAAANRQLEDAQQELLQAQLQLQQMQQHQAQDREDLVAAQQEAATAAAERHQLLQKHKMLQAESRSLPTVQQQLVVTAEDAAQQEREADAACQLAWSAEQQLQNMQDANQKNLKEQESELNARLQQESAQHLQEITALHAQLRNLEASRGPLRESGVATSPAENEQDPAGRLLGILCTSKRCSHCNLWSAPARVL